MSYDPSPPAYGQPMFGGAPVDKNREYAAIASLVLGIVSLVGNGCGILFPPCCCASLLFTLAGLGSGYYGLNSSQRTLSIAGLVLNGIGLVVTMMGLCLIILASGS